MLKSRSEHALEEALNLLSVAVFLIDSGHRVVWMNRRGKDLVESRNGVSLSNDRLRGDTPAQTREIDEILDRTVSCWTRAEPERPVLAHMIARKSSLRPLRLLAMAVCHDDCEAADRGGESGEPLSIVYIGDDETHRVCHAELLRPLFGLTPTEARVAAEVANGLSLVEVARELSLGTGTVRWHVKRIMARSDAGRQAELVRMILLSPLGFLSIGPKRQRAAPPTGAADRGRRPGPPTGAQGPAGP